MDQQIDRTTVGGAGIAGKHRGGFFGLDYAVRHMVLATAVVGLVTSFGARTDAGGRPAMPRPQIHPQQHMQEQFQRNWHPDYFPDYTPPTPPRQRAPRPRPNNGPGSVRNVPESHPDHRIQSPSRPKKSMTPEGKSLKPETPPVVKSQTPIQHNLPLIRQRYHRHVAPWVVGVYPNVPYSLGWYVQEVINGNTIRVRNPANQSQIVTLHGVALPGQAFFSQSTERLKKAIENQTVNVVNTFDHLDGSFTGKIFLGSEYVNRTQISEGMGRYDAEQGIDIDLAEAEIEAQEAERGIWGDSDYVSEMADAD